MTKTFKDGKALEQLVGIIEQVVASNENVTVEPDKKLIDKVTGEERQFDVALTISNDTTPSSSQSSAGINQGRSAFRPLKHSTRSASTQASTSVSASRPEALRARLGRRPPFLASRAWTWRR
jgi:hypothetical protein